MFIRKVLKEDQRHRTVECLDQVLGDGLLLQKNFIYRNLRRAAIARGFVFVEAWNGYAAASLLHLDEILRQKKIPVLRNRCWLEDIARRSKSSIALSDIPMSIDNHHLHEAAHCIADGEVRKVPFADRQAKILKILIAESFANTADSLCVAIARDQAHYTFARLNTYMDDSVRTLELKRALIQKVGFRTAHMLLMFSYLHGNFLYESVSPEAVQRCLKLIDPVRRFSAKEKDLAFRAMKLGLTLNLFFRTKTSSFYLKCQGIKGPISETLDFDFMKIIEGHRSWMALFERLTATIQIGAP